MDNMINEDFKHQVYKVKKQQLSYKEFVQFVTEAVTSLITDEGISVIAKEMVLKYFFAEYYLDIDLPTDELEAYDYVCDIDFFDYQDSIAWYQFCDLRDAFYDECSKMEQYINKDINTSVVGFVDNLTKVVSQINDQLTDVDMNKVLQTLGNINNLTSEEVLKYAFDRLKKDNDEKKEKKQEELNKYINSDLEEKNNGGKIN